MGARRGYTLVETLVALAVFAIGLAAILPMVVAGVRANDTAAVRTRAVALAQEKVEALRAMPFDEMVSRVPGSETVDGVFRRTWAFVPTPALPGDAGDLRRVLVEVSWSLPGRGAGSVTLVTSKARY